MRALSRKSGSSDGDGQVTMSHGPAFVSPLRVRAAGYRPPPIVLLPPTPVEPRVPKPPPAVPPSLPRPMPVDAAPVPTDPTPAEPVPAPWAKQRGAVPARNVATAAAVANFVHIWIPPQQM